MLFDVRVLAFDPQASVDPVEGLMRVFQVERAVAAELVRRLPRVIKRGVPMDVAQRFARALEKIGAHTELVVSAQAIPSTVVAASNANGDEPRASTTNTSTSRAQQRGKQALPAPNPAALPTLREAPANANAQRAQSASGARTHNTPARAQHATGTRPQAASLPNNARAYGMSSPKRGSVATDTVRGAALARSQNVSASALSEDTPLVLPEVARSRPSADNGRSTRNSIELAEPTSIHLPAMSEPDPLEADLEPATDPPPARPTNRGQALRAAAPSPVRDDESRVTYSNVARAEPRETRPSFAEKTLIDEPRTMRAPLANANLAAPAPAPPPRAAAQSGAMPVMAPISAPEVSLAPAFSVVRPAPPGLSALPPLALPGLPVDAPSVALPTKGRLVRVAIGVALLALALVVLTGGTLLFVYGLMAMLDYTRRRRMVRQIRSSAVPVGQSQLSEIYGCVKQFGLRLGLPTVPRVYVAARHELEDSAFVVGGELFIVLEEDTLVRHLERGQHNVVSFMLAHELARFALGHHKRVRVICSYFSPMLRRLDVLSADAVAAQLMIDRNAVKNALLTLLAGARLVPLLDIDELDRQAQSHERDRIVHAPALYGEASMLLARLYHLQRGYVWSNELVRSADD